MEFADIRNRIVKKLEKVFVLNTRYGILDLSCAEDIVFRLNIVNEI